MTVLLNFKMHKLIRGYTASQKSGHPIHFQIILAIFTKFQVIKRYNINKLLIRDAIITVCNKCSNCLLFT